MSPVGGLGLIAHVDVVSEPFSMSIILTGDISIGDLLLGHLQAG